MRSVWRGVVVAVFVAACLGGADAAGADAPDDVSRYGRFSEGPRHVPRPRGAALARARSLGLGTRAAATRLLTAPPEARWTGAVRGRRARTLLWPVEGARLGRGFGFTRRERTELRHEGLDVAGETGAVVRAVADGLVAYADNGVRGFGNCVMIVHADGAVSLYAHLSRITVQPGWRATRGERIGLVGATGIARGPHLHFEYREAGRTRDPAPLFAAIPGRARAASARRSARVHDVARARCGHDRKGSACAAAR
jgi:murein DD-endopeptidase MepM/ murein hydrolase activator NlpD